MASAPQTEGTAEIAPDGARPQKRRKISNACEPCRARKTRCDGDRPTCGPCRYRSNSQKPCQYAKDAVKGVEQQDMTTRSLVERIQTLERVISSSRQHELEEAQQNQATNQSTPTYGVDSERVHGERLNNHYIPSPEPPGQVVVHDAADPNSPQDVTEVEIPGSAPSPITNRRSIVTIDDDNSASPVNAMGSTVFIGSKFPRDAAGEFYGSSSAARFMQQVEEAIPDSGPKQSFIDQSGASRSSVSSVGNSGAKALNLVLPTRDLADALLDNYFAKSHSLYPFIYRPLFTRAYEDLWKPSHGLRRDTIGCDLGLGTPGLSDSQSVVFHCALNAVFALSCRLSDPVIQQHDRESLSQTFFDRCRSLLHVNILDHGSIALVQTLLIVAQYLQSTSFPSRCWTSIGLACRIGQGLGLHVEDSSGPRRDTREVEIRRRVWYGCTLMDIVASATLGRPMMTPCKITIPLPSMTAEGESGELEDALSRSTFYIATIRLYLILGKMLSTVYSPWPEADSEMGATGNSMKLAGMEAVISLDRELTIFEESVEVCLHWERGMTLRDSLPAGIRYIIQRQANVLHARFLHARVLLHRPTFLYLCRKTAPATHSAANNSTEDGSTERHLQKERGFRSKMDVDSAAMCVESTIQLVNSLNKSTTNLYDGAWWYTTFYLCTAGTVLVLAKACLAIHTHFDIDEIHAAWTLCCGTLEKLITKGHPVQHALRGLRNLHQRFVGDSSASCSTTSRIGLDNPDTRQTPSTREYHNIYDSILRPESSYDRRQPQLQRDDIAQDTGSTSNVQPLMDFMTQNINLVPFGLIDEEWWRLQHGDWDFNFSG